MTSPDAFTGANFRRGGYLPYPERYARAAEVVEVARALWDSWDDDAVLADRIAGEFLRPGAVRPVAHHGTYADVVGLFETPRGPGPQGLAGAPGGAVGCLRVLVGGGWGSAVGGAPRPARVPRPWTMDP